MRKPRSRSELEQAIATAPTDAARASAHLALAIFHDNNSREAEAIPHYEAALRLGLDPTPRAEALAWLASSLHKTGRPLEALQRIDESLAAGPTPELTRFLTGLRRRATRRLDQGGTGSSAQ